MLEKGNLYQHILAGNIYQLEKSSFMHGGYMEIVMSDTGYFPKQSSFYYATEEHFLKDWKHLAIPKVDEEWVNSSGTYRFKIDRIEFSTITKFNFDYTVTQDDMDQSSGCVKFVDWDLVTLNSDYKLFTENTPKIVLKTCTCDLYVVMNRGCLCGGFKAEMERKVNF